MNHNDIENLFQEHPDVKFFDFVGECHDCGKDTTVTIERLIDGFKISGGALYTKNIKCQKCYELEPALKQKCEIYSRVVGYMRPVQSWNNGKQQEFEKRKKFDGDVNA